MIELFYDLKADRADRFVGLHGFLSWIHHAFFFSVCSERVLLLGWFIFILTLASEQLYIMEISVPSVAALDQAELTYGLHDSVLHIVPSEHVQHSLSS